jgi:ribosomal protein S18 acetylase RimI-like enzyme
LNVKRAGRRPALSYGILQNQDLKQTVSLITEAFRGGEPLNRANDIPEKIWAESCRHVCQTVAKDQLSIVAKDSLQNRVVGAAICGDWTTPKPDTRALHPRFAVTSALLDELGKQYRQTIRLSPKHYLSIIFLAVDLNLAGHGVGTGLITRALENARSGGFKIAVCEATNRRSQHVFRDKCGFTDRFSIFYSDWEYDGRRVFDSIQGQSAILMDREI